MSVCQVERLCHELDDVVADLERLLLDERDLPEPALAALAVELAQARTALAARAERLAALACKARRERATRAKRATWEEGGHA